MRASHRKTVIELDEKEWDLAVDVCLKGRIAFKACHTAHGSRRRGSIANTGSGWGLKVGKGSSYCAAKGGVVNLTRAMAIDHGKDNIRNWCCPVT